MHDPNDAWAKKLDAMLAQAELEQKGEAPQEAVPDTEPAPPAAPPEPEDPLAKYLGKTGDEAKRKDPWAAFLDAAIAEEGRSADEEVVKVPEADQHQWESDREVLFEQDNPRVTCQKCFRSMELRKGETIGEGMQRHLIASDCALQTVGEVMSS